jgi:outer membrane protein assembly factor BamB
MKRLLIILPAFITIVLLGFTCKNSTRSDQNASSQTYTDSVDLSGKNVGWREDNRTGVSSETGLLKSWPEEGPTMVWSNTELPGGFSSVAIGNNTIYLTGFDSQNDSDVLVALDDKGKIKWQTPYGRSWNASHPETRCTPAIDSNMVYVSSGFGDLACIESNTGN